MIVFITSCALVFLAVAWVMFKIATVYLYSHWKNKNVHTGKPQFPFGNSKNVILQKIPLGFDVTDLYTEIRSRSERYGGYYNFMTPVFVPTDLDLIKTILISNSDCFMNRVSHVDEKIDPLSANLLHSGGDQWKRMRFKMSPFFTNLKIKQFLPLMMRKTDELIQFIEEIPNPLNVKELFDRYSIDLTGLYTSSIDLETIKNKDSELERQLTNFFNKSIMDTLFRFLTTIPKVVKYLKIMTFNKEVTKFFMLLFDDIVQARNRSKLETTVVLDVLTQGENFTRSEMVANIATFFLTGYETTSNALTFCLYELAYNMELQEDLRIEINTLDNSMEPFSLLDKFMKEILRKYPLPTITTRECTKTFRVPNSNIILEKGSHIYIPLRGIHWDPEYYPNPERFNPERFSEENSQGRHPCAWLPFGAGPRHCIGDKLGIMYMKVTIASLLKIYRFRLHPKTRSPLRYDAKAFVLQPENGVFLNVEKIR